MVGATLPSGFNLARQGCPSCQGTLAWYRDPEVFFFLLLILISYLNLYVPQLILQTLKLIII
jgi:hypothetical protein